MLVSFTLSLIANDSHPFADQLAKLQAEQRLLDISIGIEVEFVLAHRKYPNKATGDTIYYDSDKGKQAVHDLLSQPMQATCSTCGKAQVDNKK